MRDALIQSNAFAAQSDILDRAPVIYGRARSAICWAPVTIVASKLPQAPSMVWVDVAASLATSVMPRSMIAALNSSAVISPFAMASRKFPV